MVHGATIKFILLQITLNELFCSCLIGILVLALFEITVSTDIAVKYTQ